MTGTADGPFAELDEILGAPTLFKGDDPDQYRALQKKVERLLKPQDFFEALVARDLVNATWESVRFKTHAAELVNVEWLKALKKLASPGSGYVSGRVAKLINAYLAVRMEWLSPSCSEKVVSAPPRWRRTRYCWRGTIFWCWTSSCQEGTRHATLC